MAMCSDRRGHLCLVLCTIYLGMLAMNPGVCERSRSREATGESSDSTHVGETRQQALKGICEHTRSTILSEALENSETLEINKVYSAWEKRSKLHPQGFQGYFQENKPQSTPSNAVCVGMNETCCKPEAEKELLIVARKEYGLVYHKTIEDHFTACPTSGREFYHGMRESLKESRRQLELRINETLKTLPPNTFDQLYKYLTEFSISPDLCLLKPLIKSQVRNITQLVVERFVQSNIDFENVSQNARQMECMKNITESLMEDHVTDIVEAFGRQLYDWKIFIEGFQLAEEVIKTVKRHRFSSACVSALTRMKHCKICAGVIIFHPCNNLCLNTMLGCMADIAELEVDFRAMLFELKVLANHLETELSPEVFKDNLLEGFVNVIHDLKNTEYNWWAKTATECGGPQSIVLERERRRTLFYQPLSAGFEEEETRILTINQGGEDAFSSAFTVELGCLDELQSLMSSLPNDMCYSNHIATDSVNCWTGVALKRSDDSELAGPLKADQLNNEAYSHVRMDTTIQYADLIHRLRAMARKINTTLVYRQECSDSDDEDCTRNHFSSCEDPDGDSLYNSGSGSGCEPGSGSGSGSGFDCGSGSNNTKLSNGFEDMEVTTVPPKGVIDEKVDPEFNLPYVNGFFRDQLDSHETTTGATPETERTTRFQSTRTSDVSLGTMTILSTEDEDNDINAVDSDDDDMNAVDLDDDDTDSDDDTLSNFDVTNDHTNSKEDTEDDTDNTPMKDAGDSTTSDDENDIADEDELPGMSFSGSESLHRLSTLTPAALLSLLLLAAAYLV